MTDELPDDEWGYCDVYALAGQRTRAVVRRFRDRWLTGLEETETDYHFPEFCDRPSAVYRSAWELIDRLLVESEQQRSIYWSRNPRPDEALLSAHLFFTRDEGLIAGLTVWAENPARARATLYELAESVDARYGFVTAEEPPPYDTVSDFKARVCEESINLLPG
jgi:hypothetical protein